MLNAGSDVAAVTAPRAFDPNAAPPTAAHQPAHPSQFARPPGPPNGTESSVWGTWVATVGDYASKSMFMADRVAFALPSGGGKDLLGAIAHTIVQDAKLATNIGCL